jgi:acyl carrier protein
MTTLQRRVAKIVASIMEIPAESANLETSSDTVESWDSVRHMHLILALEEEFGVGFDDDQLVEMLSVDRITRVLEQMGSDL